MGVVKGHGEAMKRLPRWGNLRPWASTAGRRFNPWLENYVPRGVDKKKKRGGWGGDKGVCVAQSVGAWEGEDEPMEEQPGIGILEHELGDEVYLHAGITSPRTRVNTVRTVKIPTHGGGVV